MPDHLAPHPDLAGYVLGALDPEEAEAFERHLADCDACRAEVAELRGLPGLLDQAAPAVEVPPGLRERTFAAVERAAAAGRRRPLLRLAAVAAALVVALVGGVVVSQLGDRGQAVELALAPAPGHAGRATAKLRQAGDGVQVDMEVSGLAPNQGASVYECWFVGPGDTLERPNRVSAGTFRVGADGRATLRMHSAADLRRFPVMGVTLEDDGGDPRRTGDKILVSQPVR
ncbi:MAG TPA: anti-sigma factor [Actinomycetes bacterium]|nr:anti-sigma factor [Actinomycetes bacterium]